MQTLHRQGIFFTDIYVTVLGANGISANSHSLQHGVRVRLNNAAVHERAGVSFVSVAYDVLTVARCLSRQFPLASRTKAGPAATTKS